MGFCKHGSKDRSTKLQGFIDRQSNAGVTAWVRRLRLLEVSIGAKERNGRTARRGCTAIVGEVVPDDATCRFDASQYASCSSDTYMNGLAAMTALRADSRVRAIYRSSPQRIDRTEGIERPPPELDLMLRRGLREGIGQPDLAEPGIESEKIALLQFTQQGGHSVDSNTSVSGDLGNLRGTAKVGIQPQGRAPDEILPVVEPVRPFLKESGARSSPSRQCLAGRRPGDCLPIRAKHSRPDFGGVIRHSRTAS